MLSDVWVPLPLHYSVRIELVPRRALGGAQALQIGECMDEVSGSRDDDVAEGEHADVPVASGRGRRDRVFEGDAGYDRINGPQA